jgi:vancomycin resistance protein VanW
MARQYWDLSHVLIQILRPWCKLISDRVFRLEGLFVDKTKERNRTLAAFAVGACLLLALGAVCSRPGTAQTNVLGAYATDLAGRTPHQRYNARRAAAALDGQTIAPGRVFSFNRTVKGWSADRGFLRAPVSYDGVLIDDYGGGVCQTSTTVYNAALLAGLPILERHPHTFAPSYAPAGRDAAVAFPGIDLRVRNPYPWPLVLHVRPEGRMLVCRIEGPHQSPTQATVHGAELERFAPTPAPFTPGIGVKRPRWHLSGRDGVRVVVSRDISEGGVCLRHEAISDDTYLPISSAVGRAQ